MVEIATGLACLSLFLLWRLYMVSSKLSVANRMLIGILRGEVVVTQTEDGFEMEIKKS